MCSVVCSAVALFFQFPLLMYDDTPYAAPPSPARMREGGWGEAAGEGRRGGGEREGRGGLLFYFTRNMYGQTTTRHKRKNTRNLKCSDAVTATAVRHDTVHTSPGPYFKYPAEC